MKTKRKFSAIVPVAGVGTRLRPHTTTYPKVLLTVGDKPILGHILDQLEGIGTDRIYLITGYLGDKIREYVGRQYSHLDTVFVEQKEMLGLGHAVWQTAGLVKGPAFILLGDTILSADLNKFVQFKENCIGVKEVKDPRRFGVVKIKNGYVSALYEKPENPVSNLAIVGAYSFKDITQLYAALEKNIALGKTTKGEIQLTDALMRMVAEGCRLRPIGIDGWHDCGKPQTLLDTNRYLLNKHLKKFSPGRGGSLIIPPVYIAKTARVTHSIIGPNVSVGENADISFSVISESIINEKAIIQNAILSNSLIGPSATFVGTRQQLNIGENSEINFGQEEDPVCMSKPKDLTDSPQA